MHDSAPAWFVPLGPQYLNRVVFGFACVDDHRQASLTGESQLPAKYFSLYVARRIVVVIIETNLAPGDHAGAVFDEAFDVLFRTVIEKPGVVRMRAQRRINLALLFSELYCPLKCSTVRITCTDVQDCAYSRIPRALNYGLAICVVFRAINVSMGINEHCKSRPQTRDDRPSTMTVGSHRRSSMVYRLFPAISSAPRLARLP